MPATGTRAADARANTLRFVALGLALFFLASLGVASAAPVAGKDWTPQIKTTRRAQVYWETLMRAADADWRASQKSQRQTKRKIKTIKRNLDKATERRSRAKGKLKAIRAELAEARAILDPAPATPLPTFTTIPFFDFHPAQADIATGPLPPAALAPTDDETVHAHDAETVDPEVAAQSVSKLKRKAKKSKRNFKKAKRKARRIVRNVRTVRGRLASAKSGERSAVARRESAERSLGFWILAMSKYGRIRATKKSGARPGVSTSFAWPARGSLSQTYHAGHDGLDIVSYSGAPIRASAFGVVTYVGWNPWDKEGRAFMVVVTHAGGYETLYGHMLPRRKVRVGQEVRKGHVLGYMGSTGKSTGTHLHFELRRGRTTYNPLRFL